MEMPKTVNLGLRAYLHSVYCFYITHSNMVSTDQLEIGNLQAATHLLD